jgi:hypothetical protein
MIELKDNRFWNKNVSDHWWARKQVYGIAESQKSGNNCHQIFWLHESDEFLSLFNQYCFDISQNILV